MEEKYQKISSNSIDQIFFQNDPQKPKFQVVLSPHTNIYQQKFFNKYTYPNLAKFLQNLAKRKIIHLSSVYYPVNFLIKKIHSTENHRIIKFQVLFSFFVIHINVLNICESEKQKIEFGQIINEGIYGTVYQTTFFGKKAAVKQIPFSNMNTSTVINNAIKEFSILKLMSAFQVGPAQLNIFGFDLITTQKAVYFSTQRCTPLNEINWNLKPYGFDKYCSQLETSLVIMHCLNFTHNDIKPDNIMFSPSYNKIVFIDFGLSQENRQSYGQMKVENAKGTLFYCSQEMKSIFLGSGTGYIDMYYNDYIALQKTLLQLKEQFLLKQKRETYFNDPQSLQIQQVNFRMHIDYDQNKIVSEDKLIWIYIVYLIVQEDIHELHKILSQRKQIASILTYEFQKIYFVFLEVQFSLSFYRMYLEIMSVLKSMKTSLFYPSLKIDQLYLHPYFNCCINLPYQIQNSPIKIYRNQTLITKNKIEKRYSLKSNQNRNSLQNQQNLQIIITHKNQCQQKMKQIIQFFSRIQETKLYKICQDAQVLLNFIMKNYDNQQLSIWALKKFFIEIGINFKFIENESKLSQFNSLDQINFYITTIYQIYLYLTEQFSMLSLLLKSDFKFNKTSSQNKQINKQIKEKVIKFLNGLQSFFQNKAQKLPQVRTKQAKSSQQSSEQISIQEVLKKELNKYKFFIVVLTKALVIIHLTDSYENFKAIVKKVLKKFNKNLIQLIIMKKIFQSFKQQIQPSINFAQGLMNTIIDLIYYLRSNILNQYYIVADRNQDINSLIQIIQNLFHKDKIITFPQNLKSLFLTAGMQINVQDTFLQIEQYHFQSLGRNRQQVTLISKIYSLVLLIKIIPKELYSELKIFDKFNLIYGYLQNIQDDSFFQSHFKGLTLSKMINITLQEDKFQQCLNFFQKAENQRNTHDLNNYDAAVLKFYAKINYSKHKTPLINFVQKAKTSNSTSQFKPNKSFLPFDDQQYFQAKRKLSQRKFTYLRNRDQNLQSLIAQKYQQNIYQSTISLQDQWNNLISKEKIIGFDQFKLLQFNFVLFNLICEESKKVQIYISQYEEVFQKIIIKIQQAIKSFKENPLISMFIFDSIGIIDFQPNFWQNLKNKIVTTLKLRLLNMCSTKQNVLMVCKHFPLITSPFQSIPFEKYCNRIFQDMDSKFQQDLPLEVYQTKIRIQISKVFRANYYDQKEKVYLFTIIQKYFQMLNFHFQGPSYYSRWSKGQIYQNQQSKFIHLNNFYNQEMYLDILIQTYNGKIPEVQNIFSFKSTELIKNQSKFLSKNEKIEKQFKLIFEFMIRNKQIHRFFSFKISYIQFLYYLIKSTVKNLVFSKKYEKLNQAEKKQKIFVLQILDQLFKFSSKIPCSNYSYFCIKVIKLFFDLLENQREKQNCFNLIEIIEKIKIQSLNKMTFQSKNQMEFRAIILIECQILKQNLLKQQKFSEFRNQSNKMYLQNCSNSSMMIQNVLLRVCQSLDKLEYLAKTYAKQRTFKLVLLLMQNNFRYKIRSISPFFVINYNRKILSFQWMQKNFRLKHFRSICVVNFSPQKNKIKDQFILNINNIQEILEKLSPDIYQNIFIEMFKNSFVNSPNFNEHIERKQLSFLQFSVLKMVKKKIQKLIKNFQ